MPPRKHQTQQKPAMSPPPIKNKQGDDIANATDGTSTSSSSRWITKLQATTAATRKLQQSLQPYIEILNPPDNDDTVPSTITATSEQNKVVAKAIVALTLATACYLQPQLLRTDVNNNNNNSNKKQQQLTTSSTAAAASASQKKQSQQIRSDLNHIRQLLKQIQECHKRKNSSSQEEPQSVKETKSKRRKRA